VYKFFSGVFKYFPGFSSAGKAYLNTSPAPEKYFYIYLSDNSAEVLSLV